MHVWSCKDDQKGAIITLTHTTTTTSTQEEFIAWARDNIVSRRLVRKFRAAADEERKTSAAAQRAASRAEHTALKAAAAGNLASSEQHLTKAQRMKSRRRKFDVAVRQANAYHTMVDKLAEVTVFSIAELKRLRVRFRKRLREGETDLNKEAFANLMQVEYPSLRGTNVGNLFDAFDTDGSGGVDLKVGHGVGGTGCVEG